MKNLFAPLAFFLLAACSGMGNKGISGSGEAMANGGLGYIPSNTYDDMRSRDRAKDLYFGS